MEIDQGRAFEKVRDVNHKLIIRNFGGKVIRPGNYWMGSVKGGGNRHKAKVDKTLSL